MKALRKRLVPGCLFAVSLAGGDFAVGVVTRVGVWPLLMGAFCIKRFPSMPTFAAAEKAIHGERVWITLFGPLGFGDLGWEILSTANLPPRLVQLPVYQQGVRNVLEMDPVTFQPIRERNHVQGDVVIEEGVCGAEFVATRLERHILQAENEN